MACEVHQRLRHRVLALGQAHHRTSLPTLCNDSRRHIPIFSCVFLISGISGEGVHGGTISRDGGGRSEGFDPLATWLWCRHRVPQRTLLSTLTSTEIALKLFNFSVFYWISLFYPFDQIIALLYRM